MGTNLDGLVVFMTKPFQSEVAGGGWGAPLLGNFSSHVILEANASVATTTSSSTF